MQRHSLIRIAERVAPALRRVGLGGAIDRAAARFNRRLGTTTVEFDGFTFATEEIGHVYYLRDLLDHDHDRYFRRLLAEAIPAGGTVLEAGAHLGVMTLVAARAVGPDGRVLAFEPNSTTLPLLRRNIDRNGFRDRVEVVPLGLSDARGSHVFYVSGGGETSSLHDPGTATRTITITTVPGDEWLGDGATVDVVKLDIEGNEVAAVRGLRRTLEQAGPGITVFAECNPAMLAEAGHTPDELIAELRACGLVVRWIDDATESVRELADGLPASGYVNLVCSRPSG